MSDEQIAATCLIGIAVFSIGWILSWATDESDAPHPYKWGEPPRRTGILMTGIVVHVAGASFVLMCLVGVMRHLGFG